jgi:hypothetical protein
MRKQHQVHFDGYVYIVVIDKGNIVSVREVATDSGLSETISFSSLSPRIQEIILQETNE